MSYNSLSGLLSRMGKWEKSIQNAKKATYIWERALEPTHLYLGIGYDQLSDAYLGKGDIAFAGQSLQKADTVFLSEALVQHPRRTSHELLWVRYYARKAQPEPALQKLRLVIDLGFDNIAWLEEKEDLASLRPLPEFQALLAELKAKQDTPNNE